MNKEFKVGSYVKHVQTGQVGLILCVYSRSYLVECDNGDEVWYKTNVISHDIKDNDVVNLCEHRSETSVEVERIVKETVKQKNKYPVLMEHTNYYGEKTVVLITKINDGENACGTVVKSNNPGNKIGEYNEHWYLADFKPYNGDITLTNGD